MVKVTLSMQISPNMLSSWSREKKVKKMCYEQQNSWDTYYLQQEVIC